MFSTLLMVPDCTAFGTVDVAHQIVHRYWHHRSSASDTGSTVPDSAHHILSTVPTTTYPSLQIGTDRWTSDTVPIDTHTDQMYRIQPPHQHTPQIHGTISCADIQRVQVWCVGYSTSCPGYPWHGHSIPCQHVISCTTGWHVRQMVRRIPRPTDPGTPYYCTGSST